ncbi:sigma-54-dependent transcriptional regulator [Elongatibacter sediminis]|uniref:Sigma-54 dependent transcriptional regulator n=1 Tax=Elongatibacter sediminis TaxID=3119006 RepID=A0AAW9RHA0_9GAMM
MTAQAHILVVDDEPDIRELVSEILADEGYRVSTADNGENARTVFGQNTPDLVLLDIWMPDVDGITLLKEWSTGGLDCPVIVMSGHGTVETAVEATRLGAHDFVQKPISLARLLAVVSQALAANRPAGDNGQKARATQAIEPIGSSAAMQLLRTKAEQAAQHDSPVLISGEPGSGRENLARFIHARSGRSGDFVSADSFELESDCVRAYLLGRDGNGEAQSGLFDLAAGGTLFLGDIQDLPTDAQRIITQVLEAGAFVREGSSGKRELACRVIASGSANLLEMAKRDSGLEQLYYRVNVLPLEVPPLRNRADDVPDLVRFFADWFPNHEGLPYRNFSVAAQNRLRNHGWPGNIRELRNLVQRLLILGGEGDVSVAEVEDALRHNLAEPAVAERLQADIFELPLREAREQFEREYLSHQLRKAGGSVGKLAEAVEMERTHLYRKLRALGIDPKSVVAGGGK